MNPILEKYIPITKLIVATFGKHCEVVIHDFSIPQNSIVYTLNNVVTKREVGDSFTEDFVSKVLLSRKFNDDCSANYIMEGEHGKKIKSSTALIRDLNNKVVGALCVNIDIDSVANTMSQLAELIGVSEIMSTPTDEVEVISNIKEIVDDIIDKTIGDRDVEVLTRDEKIDLIKFMYNKGLFTIKGAMDKVAERMNISRVTVYSYLDEIKKNKAM